MLHISIKPEVITHIAGFPITNSLLASYIMLALFFILAYLFHSKQNDKNSRYVLFMRFVIKGIYDLFASIMGDKIAVFFPLLASYFLFILLSNWLGLLPGFGSILIKVAETVHGEIEMVSVPLLRGATADLNTTFALALISVILVQFFGIKYLGLGGYFKKFINPKNPVSYFSGVLEIISEFSKILSFAFRLFGNIFAGEVLLAVIAFLIPVLASFPFLLLEVFVGAIQALVFSMLSAVFLKMAISEHH